MSTPSGESIKPVMVLANVQDAPAKWHENQQLLFARAIMSTHLLAFQQRLSTIALRYQGDIKLSMNNEVIKPLVEVLKELEVFEQNVHSYTETSARAYFDAAVIINTEPTYEELKADIRLAIDDMPEVVRTMAESNVQSLVERPLDEVEAITVSLRRVIEYIVDLEFLGPLHEELTFWPGRVQNAYAVGQDVLRLTALQSGDGSKGEEVAETIVPILQNGIKRLTKEKDALEDQVDQLEHFIEARLETTLQQLNIYTITRSEGELQRYVRGHTTRLIQSGLEARSALVRNFFRDRITQLLYRRSEGILFARQLQDTDPYTSSLASDSLQILDAVTPKEEVMSTLPLYYQQLFLGSPTISREFWVGGEKELSRAKIAIERWRRGFVGGLAIVGEALSGKSALSNLIAQTHFKREQIFYLNPLPGGSSRVEDLEPQLYKALSSSGNLEASFAQMPLKSVMVINDLELWWERSLDGCAALDALTGWIDRYGDQCFFIVNCNIHAYKLIDRISAISGQFLDVISRVPSNAEQIKNIIMLRHRSTGLKFELGGLQEGELSAWKMAQLFTSFFDVSQGNVGAALQAWISSIRRVLKDRLILESPEKPELSLLDLITPVQRVFLLHILLHGSLSLARLQRISELDETHVRNEIQSLQRLGWLENSDTIAVDRFLAPHLIQAFVERRML